MVARNHAGNSSDPAQLFSGAALEQTQRACGAFHHFRAMGIRKEMEEEGKAR